MIKDDDAFAALTRLIRLAKNPGPAASGQTKLVADFLLAWWNARRDGGWDPTDLWVLDAETRADIVILIGWIAVNRSYLGCSDDMREIWRLWRDKADSDP